MLKCESEKLGLWGVEKKLGILVPIKSRYTVGSFRVNTEGKKLRYSEAIFRFRKICKLI